LSSLRISRTRLKGLRRRLRNIAGTSRMQSTRRDDPLIWQVHVKFLQGRSGLITFLGQNARYANSNSVLPACISTQYLTMITSHIQAGHEPTPRLWSTISISLSTSDPFTPSQLAQHWIDRSRALPLSMSIMLANQEITNENFWEPIFRVVNQCSDRWQSLWLSLPGTLLRQVRGNGRNRSRLERFKVVNTRWLGFLGSSPKPAFAKPIPSPRVIELVSVRPVGLSWSRLRNASLKNLAAHECLELLKKAPRLTCFCVINIRATGLPDPSIHVVHRAMKTLRLYTQKGTPRVPMLESFMNALTLPSLQEFDCDTLGALSREHLRELVRRSSRPLVRLRTGSRNMVASAEDAELLHQLNQFSSAD
jgi:hypothetical protein